MIAYLSSTYVDLVEYRTHAVESLERLGQRVERMEIYGARPQEPVEACLEDVRAADFVVGIYAHRYGHVPDGTTISVTEAEFNAAIENHKPLFCFLADPDFPWLPKYIDSGPAKERLDRFRNRLSSVRIRETFTSPTDLAFRIATSVGRHLLRGKPINSAENKSVASNPYFVLFRSTTTLEDLLRRALLEFTLLTGTDYNQVFLAGVDCYNLQLICVADAIPIHTQRYRLATLAGMLGTAFTSGLTLNVPDVHEHTGYFQANVETRSELTVPILSSGSVVGVLNSESERTEHYPSAIQRKVELLASAIGASLPLVSWRPGSQANSLPWVRL